MNIEVDVSGHYNTRILNPGEKPKEGTQLTTVEQNGETRQAVREFVASPQTTEIVVPDESLDQMHADHVATGGQLSRERFLARHLEDAVMSRHAPSEHWQAARVTSDGPGHAEAHEHLQNWIAQFATPATRDLPSGRQAASADTASAPFTPTVIALPVQEEPSVEKE